MTEKKLDSFTAALGQAVKNLESVKDRLQGTLTHGTLSQTVLTDVVEAQEQVANAASETRKVLDAIVGFQRILIKPIARSASLGTIITVIFGLIGVLGSIPTIKAMYKRAFPSAAIAQDPNRPPQSSPKKRRPFLGGTTEANSDSALVKRLRRELSENLLEPSEAKKKEIQQLAGLLGDTPGLTDNQLEIIHAAYYLVIGQDTQATAALDGVADRELAADKFLLDAVARMNTEGALSAGEALSKSQGESWMGIPASIRKQLQRKVLAKLDEIPGSSQKPFVRDLLNGQMSDISVTILNSTGNPSLADSVSTKLADLGIQKSKLESRAFRGKIKWAETNLFYDQGHRLLAETIAAQYSACPLKVLAKSETASLNVQKALTELVFVMGMDCLWNPGAPAAP